MTADMGEVTAEQIAGRLRESARAWRDTDAPMEAILRQGLAPSPELSAGILHALIGTLANLCEVVAELIVDVEHDRGFSSEILRRVRDQIDKIPLPPKPETIKPDQMYR